MANRKKQTTNKYIEELEKEEREENHSQYETPSEMWDRLYWEDVRDGLFDDDYTENES